MPVEMACRCEGLPAHDHYMGQALQDYDGIEAWGPVWDPNDIGKVWIDWKALARSFMKEKENG